MYGIGWMSQVAPACPEASRRFSTALVQSALIAGAFSSSDWVRGGFGSCTAMKVWYGCESVHSMGVATTGTSVRPSSPPQHSGTTGQTAL